MGRPKHTWKRAIIEEAKTCGKIWKEVKALAKNSHMEMFHTYPMSLRERMDILLLAYSLASFHLLLWSISSLKAGSPHASEGNGEKLKPL